MLRLKERVKHYINKDNFKIGAAGIHKVRKTNKLVFQGGEKLLL